MIGEFYVNNIDMYERYGISILQNSYEGVIQYSSLKSVPINNWPEDNGIEVDLSNPRLENSNFRINFGSSTEQGRIDFIEYITNQVYNEFYFVPIGVKRMYRVLSETSNTSLGITNFTIQFADDYPRLWAVKNTLQPTSVYQTGYFIDDIPFSDYGIFVRDGTDDNIERTPGVKENLTQTNRTIDSLVYDPLNVLFESKDTIFHITFRAYSLQDFYANYETFFYDIIQPGLRNFRYHGSNQTYPVYYKSARVSNFSFIGGDVWCEMDITFCFTTFRIGNIYYVLAAEDDAYVITEDELYLIDLTKN